MAYQVNEKIYAHIRGDALKALTVVQQQAQKATVKIWKLKDKQFVYVHLGYVNLQ